jgi:monofunctional biosynthetic peptidoglycan transglycosylase
VVDKHQCCGARTGSDYDRICRTLKRAVIASEDAGFAEHSGVEWDAIEKAWERNQRAEARAERERAKARAQAGPAATPTPKIVGGSTITQQLAKNLLLSGERTVLRKGQELVLTLMLEGLLSKQRILEIYLNNVEWGEGLFGAQAAARHYFRIDAARLGPAGGAAGGDAAGAQALREAARLGLRGRPRRHHRGAHGR